MGQDGTDDGTTVAIVAIISARPGMWSCVQSYGTEMGSQGWKNYDI